MSKKWISAALLACAPFCVQAEEELAKVEPKVEVKPVTPVDVDKVSETLGHLIVRHLDNPGFKFNVEKIMQGIKDEREGKPAPMSEEEYEQTIAQIQETIFSQMAEKNLSAASEFLEKNGKEEGVVSINPKLQYKVLQKGDGEKVLADGAPLVHYTGKLLDGTVFSSSVESGKPITLPIKQTIPGFSDGLVGMQKGEKRVLYIHPELAYGVSGHLPPNSLLIFEVEVVEPSTKAEETAKTEEKPVETAQAPQEAKAQEAAPETASKPEPSKEITQKDVKKKGKKAKK